MQCQVFASCAFFNTYKGSISERQYDLLVESYCEGQLQPKCRRMKWRREKSEEPPPALCPNGYLVGSASKFYD